MFGLGLVAYLRWQRALRAARFLVLAFGVGAATTIAVRRGR